MLPQTSIRQARVAEHCAQDPANERDRLRLSVRAATDAADRTLARTTRATSVVQCAQAIAGTADSDPDIRGIARARILGWVC